MKLSNILVLITVGIVCPMVMVSAKSPWLLPPGENQILSLTIVSKDSHHNLLKTATRFTVKRGQADQPVIQAQPGIFNLRGKDDKDNSSGPKDKRHGPFVIKTNDSFVFEIGYDLDTFSFGQNGQRHTSSVFPRVDLRFVWNSKGYYEITAERQRQGVVDVCTSSSVVRLPGEETYYSQPYVCIP